MMNTLLIHAAHHHPAIRLAVRVENRAAELYRSLGFVELRRIVNRVGGASLVMELRLECG